MPGARWLPNVRLKRAFPSMPATVIRERVGCPCSIRILSNKMPELRGALGVKVIICKPADPEAKGLLERAYDYLERSSTYTLTREVQFVR